DHHSDTELFCHSACRYVDGSTVAVEKDQVDGMLLDIAFQKRGPILGVTPIVCTPRKVEKVATIEVDLPQHNVLFFEFLRQTSAKGTHWALQEERTLALKIEHSREEWLE